MTNKELFKVLSKQWANVNDIKKIANCGRDKASEVRDNIIFEIEKSGKKLPISREKLVPMTKVIEFFNLNIDHIYSMAQREQTL